MPLQTTTVHLMWRWSRSGNRKAWKLAKRSLLATLPVDVRLMIFSWTLWRMDVSRLQPSESSRSWWDSWEPSWTLQAVSRLSKPPVERRETQGVALDGYMNDETITTHVTICRADAHPPRPTTATLWWPSLTIQFKNSTTMGEVLAVLVALCPYRFDELERRWWRLGRRVGTCSRVFRADPSRPRCPSNSWRCPAAAEAAAAAAAWLLPPLTDGATF